MKKAKISDKEFNGFYQANYKRMVNHLVKKVANHEDAEDITQEAFCRFYETYEPGYVDPITYLYSLIKNLMKDYYKTSTKALTVVDIDSETVRHIAKDIRINIERDYINRESELILILDEEINQLPALYRDIIISYYYSNKTQEEIANKCNLWQERISIMLSEGRRLLKHRLSKRGIAIRDLY